MKQILFINACVRGQSRTKRLAEHLLARLNGTVTELRLSELPLCPLDEGVLERRHEASVSGDFSDSLFSLARQFAAADCIVIAAPYWDLSFPAALKQYFEQINVSGVTFSYSPEGIPIGHCRAKKLYYVTTAGGQILSPEFGYGYVKALAQNFYGIRDCELIKAVGLDIDGADAEAIMQESMRSVSALFG